MRPARRDRGSRPEAGKFGPNRDAWVLINGHEFIHSITPPAVPNIEDELNPETSSEKPSPYEHTSVTFKPRRARGATLSLTLLTVAELDALEAFWVHAFTEARPICALLDHEAKIAEEAGDDSFTRNYRPVPELVIRERREPRDAARVPERSDGLHPMGESGSLRDAGGTGERSSTLADDGEGAQEAKDDQAPAYITEVMVKVLR